MGLFSRLLGRRDAEAPESAAAAEQGQLAPHADPVAYDAGLIAALENGHRELLRICSAVQSAADEYRYNDIQHLLTHFKLAFQAHVAMENAHFYAYLQPRIARNREAVDLIAEVRRDMNEIGYEVLKVVDAYIAYPPTHLTEVQFKYDFEHMAALLASRVEELETRLYPLYRP
jgi:Hemerythrin HHE cation binding domain